MRFFGIAVTFATSPVTSRVQQQLRSKQYCLRWLATLENAGQARPTVPAAACSEWPAVSWANQQAEMLFGSSPHPRFFSAKKSSNRSDSIAARASDITR